MSDVYRNVTLNLPAWGITTEIVLVYYEAMCTLVKNHNYSQIIIVRSLRCRCKSLCKHTHTKLSVLTFCVPNILQILLAKKLDQTIRYVVIYPLSNYFSPISTEVLPLLLVAADQETLCEPKRGASASLPSLLQLV